MTALRLDGTRFNYRRVCGAANERDELAPLHSITSSASGPAFVVPRRRTKSAASAGSRSI
jgi:hypothetical protein